MRKSLLGLFLCCSVLGASAQTFSEIWKKSMMPFYASTFDIEITMQAYSNSFRIGQLESTTMRYRRLGDNMLITSPDIEQLRTKKVQLIVDHLENVLMVAPTLNKDGVGPRMEFDSLFAITTQLFRDFSYSEPKESKNPDGTVSFVFVEPNDFYDRVEFCFNAQKTLLTSVFLLPSTAANPGLEESTMPEIEYSFIYRKSNPPESLFSLSNYILVSGKKCTPAKKYSSYTVLSQL